MSTLGMRQWRKLLVCALAESPDDVDDLSEEDLKEWVHRTKVTRKQRYGFDPLTWLLISIVVRIAIELIILWLKNRSEDDRRAIKLACVEVLPKLTPII